MDNARRLRNLIVHNHGLFNSVYESDTNNSIWNIEMHPNYAKFKKENVPTPIEIKSKDVIDFSKAHIEVLHLIYNSIQENLFGVVEGYDYRKKGKNIEWNKVLWGI